MGCVNKRAAQRGSGTCTCAAGWPPVNVYRNGDFSLELLRVRHARAAAECSGWFTMPGLVVPMGGPRTS